MLAGIFLVPNATFFVELVVVIALIVALMKFGIPKVMVKMEERQELIRSSLEAADRARKDAEAADDERHHVLDEARGQAREIVASAQQTAEQVRADAAKRGQAEYERIAAAAAADVQAARQRAVEEAASRMGEIVIEVVTKIVGREIDANAHRELINEAITALNDENQKGAGQTV
ncbi:MAG TPA: F0F1 ATP synthase subunit B [Acidimicrobiales bacterium]|jgi:F-type H+-transporting ATPase subunit b|nr:F0F1 ATP synthase subunit B [Acidimicrobiales bacterium]